MPTSRGRVVNEIMTMLDEEQDPAKRREAIDRYLKYHDEIQDVDYYKETEGLLRIIAQDVLTYKVPLGHVFGLTSRLKLWFQLLFKPSSMISRITAVTCLSLPTYMDSIREAYRTKRDAEE